MSELTLLASSDECTVHTDIVRCLPSACLAWILLTPCVHCPTYTETYASANIKHAAQKPCTETRDSNTSLIGRLRMWNARSSSFCTHSLFGFVPFFQFPGGLPPQGLSAASMAAAAAGVGLPPGLHPPPGGAAPARLDLPPSVSLAQLSSAAPGIRPEHPPPPPPSAGPPNSGPDSKVRLLGLRQACKICNSLVKMLHIIFNGL